MKAFTFERAGTPADAAAAAARRPGAKFIAGGTNLLDLMKRPEMSNAEFRERMSGNICRCGAYSNIQEAIAEVAGVKRA